MHLHRLAVGALAVAVLAPPAHAQPRDDDEGIPAGYAGIEVSDLTFTLRDDDFSVITADPGDPRTAFVGTFQGRVYKTVDGGQTWTESTVIPEQKLLWSTSGSTIFFGAIRSPGDSSGPIDLIGRGLSLQLARMPSRLGRLPTSDIPTDPLAVETAISAGGGASFLGVGLSMRSPRLSLLTGSRGRPVPVLNRVKLLADRTLRGSAVLDVRVDPSDRRLVFAATQNGLYKSYDGGASWARIFAGMTSAERLALRIAPRLSGASLMILGTLSGAYTSTDHGDNWSKILTVGGAVNDVAYDLKDPSFIYLATNGGVMRSSDGGQNFLPIYYSTFPAEVDVRSVFIDPFDPKTVYIGTMRGAYVTHNARTASFGDWTALEGVQSILAVPSVTACRNHRGHLYAMTRLEMNTINYGADAPASAVLESWDSGHTWRQVFTGESDGTVSAFAMDVKDPDELWIAWTKALHRLERGGNRTAEADDVDIDRGDLGPPLGRLVLEALRYHGLELDDYIDHIQNKSNLLPRALTITAGMHQFTAGGTLDDNTFAAQRYLQNIDSRVWAVMAWASWSLPSLVYNPDKVPMLRQRVNTLNDELRRRIVETVRRSYGELLRIRARLRASPPTDLATRVLYRLRIEQLEAVIDLASGDYLSRWHKSHRRNAT